MTTVKPIKAHLLTHTSESEKSVALAALDMDGPEPTTNRRKKSAATLERDRLFQLEANARQAAAQAKANRWWNRIRSR